MNKYSVIFAIILFLTGVSKAQDGSAAAAVASTAMNLWKDSFLLPNDKVAKWRYDQGVILKGIEGLWYATGDKKYFDYIRKSMDFYVSEDGTIRGYKANEYNIDHINNGKLLLLLLQVTKQSRYRKAAEHLRNQLRTHPRTSEGGFWHKNIYPNQMWLDGLYMAQPFYAEYAWLYNDDTAFNDISRQFLLMEKNALDKNTGLLYHGWDESRQQQWADKQTGRSPNVWGRALGWFGMAMVDALDYFPENHHGRDSIIRILNNFVIAVVKQQDQATGLWYDVLNVHDQPKNYVEASASAMLVYTIAKAVRMGYIAPKYLANASRAYEGILSRFVKVENNTTNLHGTVAVSGLGGKPYRDGSFEYYMSEPVIVNDPKGMGAFINAANEMEMVKTSSPGKGRKVVLDYYYNNEWKEGPGGNKQRWHYTWEDKSDGGFYTLGHMFRRYGAQLDSLTSAPSASALKGKHIYIIVDPDNSKETEKPNIIQEAEASVIAQWVHQGGTLLLLANDSGNNNLKSINTLSAKFGIRFNEDKFNEVPADQPGQGAVEIAPSNPIFRKARKLFIKELATLQVSSPARTIVTKNGKNIIACSRYGKGTVLAVGDPWLYNEYVDGRRPLIFDNFTAGEELVQWLLSKTSTE